jgi:cobalt-zinc-cadmium efflux system outer membrane protein
MKHILIFILFISNLLNAQQDTVSGISGYSKHSDTGLTDLVNAAIKTNVNLEPVELEQKLLSARIDQAGYQPSPMLEFMIDDLPVNFSDAGMYKVNYSQPLKLFGKLNAMESLARINSLRPDIQKEALQIELIKMVKENYFMLSVNERLLSFNNEFKEIMNSITGSLEIKYSVGKGSQYDILKSNNEYQKLLLEEIDLSNNKKIFINNLRTLTNIDLPDDFMTKNLNILLKIIPPDMDTAKLISEMKLFNTDYKLLDQQSKENNIETTIAELERKPDMSLLTGYKYNSGKQESFLTFGIGVELPFMPWNDKRIDALISEKIIMEKKINSEVKSLDINLKNELKNIIVKINSSQEKIKYLTEVLIPQTEETFKSSLISYETAANQFIDLLDTYRTLRVNNEMLVEEETNYLILISGLEKLIGKQILTIN